jgi:hypothetical protein
MLSEPFDGLKRTIAIIFPRRRKLDGGLLQGVRCALLVVLSRPANGSHSGNKNQEAISWQRSGSSGDGQAVVLRYSL